MSRMTGDCHVRFLEEGPPVRVGPYCVPCMGRI